MKILNCITNSFFRTIGRILAYLAIGALLVALLSKAHLPSFEEIINDSLFIKINASTGTPTNDSLLRLNVPLSAWLNYNTDNINENSVNLSQYNINTWNNSSRFFGFETETMQSNTSRSYYYTFTTNDTFMAQHTYAITQYVTAYDSNGACIYATSPNDLYDVDFYYTGYNMSNSNTEVLFFNVLNGGSQIMNLEYDIEEVECTSAITYIVNTKYIGNYIRLPIKFTAGSYNNKFLGYTLQDLGYTTEYLESLITSNTNGLATARSVQEVQQQLNGISNSIDSQTSAITNNNNQNTQQIIQNQEANTNATIENQNQNTQQQIESQQVCQFIDKQNIKTNGKLLDRNGLEQNGENYGITDYINIEKSTIKILDTAGYNIFTCFYTINKTKISCVSESNVNEITIPTNASYAKFTINKLVNKPTFNICTNGNQALANTLTDNNINDSEVANELEFNMPDTSLGPFSGFLALPLTWVQSLLSSNNNCSELVLPLPFVNQNITLPCMYTFWQKMGILGTLVQAVWIAVVGVRIFNGLFLLVIEVRSPEGNADYLTKIRSWEL